MTTTASTSTSQPPPASGPTEDIDNYIHGYSAHESRRLADQADTLSDLLHHDTAHPVGAKVLEVGCGVGTQTAHLVAVPAGTVRVGAGSCGEPRGAVPGPGHRRPASHRDGRRRRHVPLHVLQGGGSPRTKQSGHRRLLAGRGRDLAAELRFDDVHVERSVPQLMRDTMAMATEVAMAFPRLRTRLGTPAATHYSRAPDQTFELGLRALLDGLAANRTTATS